MSRGNWKLIHTAPGRPPSAIAELPAGGFKTPERIELYDISADPGETQDLAERNPAQLQRLLGLWDDYEREVGVIYSEEDLPIGF